MDTKKQESNSSIQLLTAKEAGKICKLSKRSWFRFSSAGRTPKSIRIGGSVRWRLSDIELWLSWDCPDRKTFEAKKGVQL